MGRTGDRHVILFAQAIREVSGGQVEVWDVVLTNHDQGRRADRFQPVVGRRLEGRRLLVTLPLSA
jgi:hypothetical protein